MKLTIEIDIKGFEMYHDLAEDKDAQKHFFNESLYEMIAGMGDWDSFTFDFTFREVNDGKE